MTNVIEWLNEKIPEDQRAQVTCLHICGKCQNEHDTYDYYCTSCPNSSQDNISSPPIYKFSNTILEGELNLNSFVNLEELRIAGVNSN